MSNRCRFGRNCHYHPQGNCRFYHSPSPSRSRSRSRSRDRAYNSNNKNNNNTHHYVNLTLQIQNEQNKISNNNPLQFISHDESKKWGRMSMKQTADGLEMTAMSNFPTRIGRCNLMAGKYYYEVHLQTTPCNSRIGWGLHSQNIDDINGMRTGEDHKGWAYNGWTKGGSKFSCQRKQDYGQHWTGNGDVVSCAVDIDSRQMRFYLNGLDLGIAFSQCDFGKEGVAPSISVSNQSSLSHGCTVLVVTEKAKFKYAMPNRYCCIQTGFKMTWSRINDRVATEFGNKIGKILRNVSDTDIDANQIENILDKLSLDCGEKIKLKQFIRKEFEFVPTINPQIKRNEIGKLLENRGFKLCHITQVLNANYNGGDVDGSELNILISKCVECESKDVYAQHIKQWKQWNCVEVIEWINTLSNGRFVDRKYSTFKEYLKIMKVDGIQLESVYDLTLKLLTLNDANDRSLIVMNVDKLTQRKRMQIEIEPPKEYMDPISFELMCDPVICIKSGYTYDRNTILNQIRTNGSDPFTRDRIHEHDLIPNRVIKECIDKWRKENDRK